MDIFDTILGVALIVVPLYFLITRLHGGAVRFFVLVFLIVFVIFPYMIVWLLGGNPGRALRVLVQSMVTPAKVQTISCGADFEFKLTKGASFASGNKLELGTESEIIGVYSLDIYRSGHKLALAVVETNPLVFDVRYGFKLGSYPDIGDIYDPATNHLKIGMLPINILLDSDEITQDNAKRISECVAKNETVIYQYAENYLFSSSNIHTYKVRGVYVISALRESIANSSTGRKDFTCANGSSAYIEIDGDGFVSTRDKKYAQIVLRNDGSITPSYFAIDAGKASIAEQILPTCVDAEGESITNFYRNRATRISLLSNSL